MLAVIGTDMQRTPKAILTYEPDVSRTQRKHFPTRTILATVRALDTGQLL